eukprot:1695852-Prymnesium_polylepis.1
MSDSFRLRSTASAASSAAFSADSLISWHCSGWAATSSIPACRVAISASRFFTLSRASGISASSFDALCRRSTSLKRLRASSSGVRAASYSRHLLNHSKSMIAPAWLPCRRSSEIGGSLPSRKRTASAFEAGHAKDASSSIV